MVPEAVFGMLACARIGAVHSVVFGGFAAKELATRIDDCKPKLILSASCGIEPGRVVHYKPLLDQAIELAKAKPQACIILQRPQQEASLVAGRDHDWAVLRDAALRERKSAPCVPVLATDPWIKGAAYFGSWTTSHLIPEEQLAHVKACKYLWISHGHPDHLSMWVEASRRSAQRANLQRGPWRLSGRLGRRSRT
jgi:hypothetical protein